MSPARYRRPSHAGLLLLGLRTGDVIVAINRQSLAGVPDVPAVLQREPGGLQLHIRRGSAVLSIFIRD